MTKPADNPDVLIFPPLLAAVTVALGFVLHRLVPWRLPLSPPVRMALAITCFALALAVGLAGERAMHRVGTNVNPRLPSTAVATTGPFRFSRNPLYLFLIGVYLGVTAAVASVWYLVLLVPMFLVLDIGVVRREERYLEAKFGDEYRAYKARVRRWL